jgi:transcriptional regulator with XRE-family HTH domain
LSCPKGVRVAEQEVDPAVHRRKLRTYLRSQRVSRGVTQSDAAKAMSWSLSKLIRIETGDVTISINDLKALLSYYEVSENDIVGRYAAMAQNSRKPSWLSPYKGIATDVYLQFLGHEDSAASIYNFEPVLVPGLLQTDEYALEVLRTTRGPKGSSRIDSLVNLRITRQERIHARGDGVRQSYVVDEAVIRRVVGGTDIMRRQLAHLLEACEHEHVALRVIPFTHGLYRSVRVPFVLLEFRDPEDETILYLEYPQGEKLFRDDGSIEEGGTPVDAGAPTSPPTYQRIFAELHEYTSDSQTTEILESALRTLG